MSTDTAPGRPLPLVTPENEFFWRSGADGRLRFTECESCKALIHPPQPVCRYCRGRQMGVRAVSGYATLIGFTVNHRFSLPGLPAPYVVAQVAIEEDPRVRLTTNAIGCEPGQVQGRRWRRTRSPRGLPVRYVAPAPLLHACPCPGKEDHQSPGCAGNHR